MVITPILTNNLYINSLPKYTNEEIINIIDKYIDKHNFVNVTRYSSAMLSNENKKISMKYINVLYLSYIDGANTEIIILKNDLSETEYTDIFNLLQVKYLSKVDGSFVNMNTYGCVLWKNNFNYDKLYYCTVNIIFNILDECKSFKQNEQYKMLSMLKITSDNAKPTIVHFGDTSESTITGLNYHILFDDCAELYYVKERMQRDLANGNELVELAEYNSNR